MQVIKKNLNNPKQDRTRLKGRESWFPYYAGFSAEFARKVIELAHLSDKAAILDPWNGAGTTTSAARELGYQVVGLDLNPAMVVAAKARCLSSREKNSLEPLAADLVSKAALCTSSLNHDPLCSWMTSESAVTVRTLELSIRQLLTSVSTHECPLSRDSIESLSDIASFFYVALFRTCKKLLVDFIPSNPTWTKTAKTDQAHLQIRQEILHDLFVTVVSDMAKELDNDVVSTMVSAPTSIRVGNSEVLPFESDSIDFVLSSPPYCTRIDYAVATMIELAVLGYGKISGFESLRRSLIGTSTVPNACIAPATEWGRRCNDFLQQIYNHSSKASRTYYFKSHTQYFNSMYNSLKEIARVLKVEHQCVIVVQDSFYKNVHNDLPGIILEMSSEVGLGLIEKVDFATALVRANMHPAVKKYRARSVATESVLWLAKRAEV